MRSLGAIYLLVALSLLSLYLSLPLTDLDSDKDMNLNGTSSPWLEKRMDPSNAPIADHELFDSVQVTGARLIDMLMSSEGELALMKQRDPRLVEPMAPVHDDDFKIWNSQIRRTPKETTIRHMMRGYEDVMLDTFRHWDAIVQRGGKVSPVVRYANMDVSL